MCHSCMSSALSFVLFQFCLSLVSFAGRPPPPPGGGTPPPHPFPLDPLTFVGILINRSFFNFHVGFCYIILCIIKVITPSVLCLFFNVLLGSFLVAMCYWVVWELRSLIAALPCWSCSSYFKMLIWLGQQWTYFPLLFKIYIKHQKCITYIPF
jgi:hypothetical protein